MSDYNDHHRELREGEIFLMNGSVEDYRTIDWKTKRMGQWACDASGGVVGTKYLHSIFVQKSELEEAGVNVGSQIKTSFVYPTKSHLSTYVRLLTFPLFYYHYVLKNSHITQ